MLHKRRGMLRTAAGALFGASVTLLVMTIRRPGETAPPVTSALVRSADDLTLSLSEVTTQLARALAPANQGPPCRSTIYPGGSCRCSDFTSEDSCDVTPAMDGKNPACLGTGHLLPGRPCLVYSVGMQGDLAFEREMVKFGCTVHVFDPLRTLNASVLPPGMHVHSIGVGGVTQTISYAGHDVQMMTLDDLVHRMGHRGRQIDYLSMAAVGEWDVLRQQLDGGAALRRIAQLAVTLHLRSPQGIFERQLGAAEQPGRHDVGDFLQRVKDVEAAGFQLTWSRPGRERFDGTTLSHEYRTFWVQ